MEFRGTGWRWSLKKIKMEFRGTGWRRSLKEQDKDGV